MERSDEKIIFCIIGKMGSGKDSILRKLKPDIPEISTIVPVTTREKRPGEKDGIDYIFVDDNEFDKMLMDKKFMEHRKYNVIQNGKKAITQYGYPYPNDKVSIVICPYLVYKAIKSNILNEVKNVKIFPIYIKTVSEDEALYRAINREARTPVPNFREVARRFVSDLSDFPSESDEKMEFGDSIFINYDLNKTVDEILHYIDEKLENNE